MRLNGSRGEFILCRAWVCSLVVCVVLGVVLDEDTVMTKRFAHGLIAGSSVSGLVFGRPGMLLPASGAVAYGVAQVLGGSGGGPKADMDITSLTIAWFLIVPVVAAIPALLGASLRRRLLAGSRPEPDTDVQTPLQ